MSRWQESAGRSDEPGRMEENWECFTSTFLAARGASAASPHTLKAYRSDLAAFGAWYRKTMGTTVAPHSLTELDVSGYRRHLIELGRRPDTVNRALATMKTAMAWGFEEDRIRSNTATAVRLVPESCPGPRALDRRELGALLREARRARPGRVPHHASGPNWPAHRGSPRPHLGRRCPARAFGPRDGSRGEGAVVGVRFC